jgi:hypothetical protein
MIKSLHTKPKGIAVKKMAPSLLDRKHLDRENTNYLLLLSLFNINKSEAAMKDVKAQFKKARA